MTSMPHLPSMAWDHNDQMREIDLGGGGTAYYTYDAAGQRVRKVWEHSGLIEERIYLGGWEVYRKRDSLGNLLVERETLHGMDGAKRVVLVETKTVDVDAGGAFSVVSRYRFQLDNHLGSASLEVDESGLVIGYEEYHPYGTTAYTSGRGGVEVSGKRYRYTGKERDEETGLCYHGARHMAPWLGRWMSADPAGIGADGVNLYAYVRGNPVGLIDPTGNEARTTYLGSSNTSADLARRQKFWRGNQYWSNYGSQGAGWYIKTDGNRILSRPAPKNRVPLPLSAGPGTEFLNWDPSKSLQTEEAPKPDGVKIEADVSPLPEIGVPVAALPAIKAAAEAVVEEAPLSGIRRIGPVAGEFATGVAGMAALVGAAAGSVVFLWNTNTKTKRWMDELDPTTGVVYKSQEAYERNSPEFAGMRARRRQPEDLGPTADPWAEEGPDSSPNTGDPCDRAPVDRCESLGNNFKHDSREDALKAAEALLGKGPYRTSPGGSNRGTGDEGFPPGSTHETYLTPDNYKFSIGSAPCCENVGGFPVIRTRWAFYK